MKKIEGVKIADGIIQKLKGQPAPKKILAAVLVGEDPASISFLKQKEKVTKELGIDFRLYKLSPELKNDGLRKEIGRIARQGRVGGIIVQLPLPEGINRRYVLNAIPPEKDIDVLSEKAQEAFRKGGNPVLPPAVGVVHEVLATSHWSLVTSKVAVVGLGFLVGKPISVWLKSQCTKLYFLDKGDDLGALKNADLIITGAGEAGLVKPEMLKDESIIIDFGYSLDENGKIRGDFDTESLKAKSYKLKAISYTPTPGGTGPILVAKLMENFYKLNAV